MKKKILLVVLSLCLIFSLSAPAAWAAGLSDDAVSEEQQLDPSPVKDADQDGQPPAEPGEKDGNAAGDGNKNNENNDNTGDVPGDEESDGKKSDGEDPNSKEPDSEEPADEEPADEEPNDEIPDEIVASPQPGVLTVCVSAGSEADGQLFMFLLSSEDGSIALRFAVPANEAVTISGLTAGSYSVSCVGGWAWRYELQGEASRTVTVAAPEAAEGEEAVPMALFCDVDVLEFTFGCVSDRWLSGSAVCEAGGNADA